MNCQDHLYRNADPRQVSRRWFFEQCGVGLGSIALGHLLQDGRICRVSRQVPRASIRWRRKRRNSHPRPSGCCFCSWPVHRAISSCSINKPQLAKFDGTLPPPELIKGYRAAFIKPSSKLLGPKFKFARHGQCGTELSELLAAPGDRRRRHRGRQGDGHRRLQPRARADHDEHRLADLRPAEHGCLGLLRPGKRVARPARLRRFQHGQEGAQRRQLQLGQRLPAHRLPGGPVPDQRRSGPVSLQPAAASTPSCSATRSTRSTSSTNCGSTKSAIPRSPPGSTRTRWPSACSSRHPT